MDFKTAIELLLPIQDEIKEIQNNQNEIITLLSSAVHALLTLTREQPRFNQDDLVGLCNELVNLIDTKIMPNQNDIVNQTENLNMALNLINFSVDGNSFMIS